MAKDVKKMGGNPWPRTVGSDSGVVWGSPGAEGCAGVHRGAVREHLGDVLGSFRSSKSVLGAFGGAFRWYLRLQKWVVTTTSCSGKDGRMHGSQHEGCVAPLEFKPDDEWTWRPLLFTGSAHVASGQEIRRPRRACGVVEKKRGRASRSSVKRCFQEEKGGRWAGKQPSPAQSSPCLFQCARGKNLSFSNTRQLRHR